MRAQSATQQISRDKKGHALLPLFLLKSRLVCALVATCYASARSGTERSVHSSSVARRFLRLTTALPLEKSAGAALEALAQTSGAWLAATTACAQLLCHTFFRLLNDPFSRFCWLVEITERPREAAT